MLKSSYILSGVAALMMAVPVAAHAQTTPDPAAGYVTQYEWKRLDYNHFRTLSPEDQSRLRIYREYEQREPCQNYRKLPVDLTFKDCKLYHRVALPPPPAPPAPPPAPAPAPLVLSSYEVFFKLDSTALDVQADAMIDKAASDISQYKPSSVVVAGYTDTSGSADYNDALSAKRAAAVSAALTKRGVANTVLNQEAHGQNDLKVPTADNVHEAQNRRTVIHFMK